jgi:probable HAF family extracellular repeat protein
MSHCFRFPRIKKSILVAAIYGVNVASLEAVPLYSVAHISGSENPVPPNFQNQFVDINNHGQMLMEIRKAIPSAPNVAAVSLDNQWVVINQNKLPKKFTFMKLTVLDLNNKTEVLGIIPTIQGSHGFVASFSKSKNKLGKLTIQQVNRDLGNGIIGLAINDNSQVVGSYVAVDGNEHAFLDTNGVRKDLGTLGRGGYSVAYSLNNCGQIVGESNGQAFVSYKGVMKALGEKSVAKSINDRGQIAGNLTVIAKGKGYEHAFITNKGEIKDLLTLGGSKSSANKINAGGQVVGTSETSDGKSHAFVTINGVMTDLNNVVDPQGLIDSSTIDPSTHSAPILK